MMLKKALTVVLVVALVAGLTTPLMAAETKGKVVAVHSAKGELVLSENFKNRTFVVNNSTTIMINDREARLNEIKPGDMAFVSYEKEGDRMIATGIRCRRK